MWVKYPWIYLPCCWWRHFDVYNFWELDEPNMSKYGLMCGIIYSSRIKYDFCLSPLLGFDNNRKSTLMEMFLLLRTMFISTHWGRVTHIYSPVNKPSLVDIITCRLVGVKRLSGYQAVTWSASSRYIVNSNIKNKIQWNLKRNSCIFIEENAFVLCEMAAILSGP